MQFAAVFTTACEARWRRSSLSLKRPGARTWRSSFRAEIPPDFMPLSALASRLQLRSNRKLSELQIDAIHVADFLHDDADTKEEVVIARLEADLLEVQCHGGRWAAESILRCLALLGATILSAEQWT